MIEVIGFLLTLRLRFEFGLKLQFRNVASMDALFNLRHVSDFRKRTSLCQVNPSEASVAFPW